MKYRLMLLATWLTLGFGVLSHAHELQYSALLSGPAESPPNASPGFGFALVTIDLDLVTMRVEASFSNLTGTVTAAHIHSATATPGSGVAGVATQVPTFPGFPSGVTSGSYDQTFDLTLASSYNPTFITANGGTVSGALNALLFGIDEGRAYFNIHSSTFPGGEIRGFLTAVPEPSTLMLSALGGIGLLVVVWRQRRQLALVRV